MIPFCSVVGMYPNRVVYAGPVNDFGVLGSLIEDRCNVGEIVANQVKSLRYIWDERLIEKEEKVFGAKRPIGIPSQLRCVPHLLRVDMPARPSQANRPLPPCPKCFL